MYSIYYTIMSSMLLLPVFFAILRNLSHYWTQCLIYCLSLKWVVKQACLWKCLMSDSLAVIVSFPLFIFLACSKSDFSALKLNWVTLMEKPPGFDDFRFPVSVPNKQPKRQRHVKTNNPFCFRSRQWGHFCHCTQVSSSNQWYHNYILLKCFIVVSYFCMILIGTSMCLKVIVDY